MTVELINPAGLPGPVPYSHVAVGKGTRLVYVAGQVDWDADQNRVAGDDDLAGQIVQVLRNVSVALTGVGAGFDDVVRLTFYVAGWDPAEAADLGEGLERATAELSLPSPLPPSTIIGVSSLFAPGLRVELEATAVID